jgi:mannose-6-phosphate isomerase
MFVAITNTPRPYAWGSHTAIAELLGREPSGEPEAELWLGAHPGSPSAILDPALAGGSATLDQWIADDPARTLGRFASGARLPFLLKVLAAAHPLSLQAHPTPEQAERGFARENALGIPLDAADRNYKDESAKPELIYALSGTFDALCGFRPVEQSQQIVEALLDLDAQVAEPQPQPLEGLRERLADDSLESVFEWLVSGGAGVPTLVDRVVALAPFAGSSFAAEFETVRALAAEYPGDPGIVISLLLNRVTLSRGEALYLPAGNIHAYLNGLGVELMAASDNVLRGGLTPKHIDVPELLGVLDFAPVPIPYLRPSTPSAGVEVFRPDVPDFELVRISGDDLNASYELTGPAIALCTEGTVSVAGVSSRATLRQGESIFITPDEGALRFAGSGELFLATTGE